jgi:hypothetical protein
MPLQLSMEGWDPRWSARLIKMYETAPIGRAKFLVRRDNLGC